METAPPPVQALPAVPAPHKLPGVLLATFLAGVAWQLAAFPLLAPVGTLCLALLVGMAWRATFGEIQGTAPGIKVAAKTLLRLGIVLLGVRLNYALVATAGPGVLALDLAVVVVGISGIAWLARRVGLPRDVGILMAVGTGICGASAVVAAGTVIKAKEEDTTAGVALMGLLGTLGVFAYAALGPWLHLPEATMGVMVGSTLHEVAQVAAAAFNFGPACVDVATMVKLTRVVLLAPALIVVGAIHQRAQAAEVGRVTYSWREPPVPWFVIGFLVVGVFNTLGVLTPVQAHVTTASVLLMAIAMAAMGLNTDWAMLKRLGWKALAVGWLGFMGLVALAATFVASGHLGGQAPTSP